MTQAVISRKLNPSPAQCELEDRLCDLITAHGSSLLIAPDLYHLPEDSSLWPRLAVSAHHSLIIGWQQVRALVALVNKHNVIPAAVVSLSDFTTVVEAFDAIEAILDTIEENEASAESDEPALSRWYPVIDETRCINCGHCHQFCLFNVYEKDENGHVQVANPDNCKPGCPACARICPSSAIIFPEYTQDPAICGVAGCYVTVDEKTAAMFHERIQNNNKQTASPAVLDEIDSLINELNDLSGGGND